MLHKCVLFPHIHMCGEEHKNRETVTFPSANIQLKDRILFRLQIFSALPAKDIKYIHIVTVSGLAEGGVLGILLSNVSAFFSVQCSLRIEMLSAKHTQWEAGLSHEKTLVE